MSSFAQSFFSRRTAFRFAIGLALIVTLLFGVRAFENWRGERVWAAYRAAVEKRDVHLSLMDFVPPDVSDAENFAAIPIIQEIFSAADAGHPVPNPLDWPKKFKPPAIFANPLARPRIDLAKWRDAFVAARMLAQPTDNPAQDVLASLVSYEAPLAQLHAAGLRPHSRFPVKWQKMPSASQPTIGLMMAAAKLDALRISAHLALGDSAAAYAGWRDALALYRALEHEPTLISGLVRIHGLLIVQSAIWDGLAGRQWSEPELRALSSDLASLNLVADWQFTCASERGWMNAMMDSVATLPFHDAQEFYGSFFMNRFFPVGWLRQSQVKINEVFDHGLARIDLAHGVVFAGDAADDAELSALRQKGAFATLPYMFALNMMPSFSSAEAKFLSCHTAAQQTRLACALELFRRAHGAYPERLDELVPDLLEALPRDVMDGAPMRYRRDGENFKLWSIALNRTDDAGESGPAPKPADQLDWVWHY